MPLAHISVRTRRNVAQRSNARSAARRVSEANNEPASDPSLSEVRIPEKRFEMAGSPLAGQSGIGALDGQSKNPPFGRLAALGSSPGRELPLVKPCVLGGGSSRCSKREAQKTAPMGAVLYLLAVRGEI